MAVESAQFEVLQSERQLRDGVCLSCLNGEAEF